MTAIKRVDHVAVVVTDIDEALAFWQDALGLELEHVEELADQDAVVAFLPAGDSEIELVRPISEESGIARYLSKRGPGVHHICFEVDDIQAALDRLKQNRIRLIHEQPLTGSDGRKFAFIHPEGAHGVLVELYQLPPDG
jgi:methylmalonyl-CoA/ethylmalonyl-CoA epimerase